MYIILKETVTDGGFPLCGLSFRLFAHDGRGAKVHMGLLDQIK